MISLAGMRYHCMLWVIGLYLILNAGFMQLRIPPTVGAGVPVGELVLLVSLLTLNYATVLPRLHAVAYLVPFLLWWGFGLGRAIFDASDHGMWALRDASHVIDSLFLIVGFVVVARASLLDRLFAWLPRLLLVGGLYALLYPIRETIQGYSPTIRAGAGYDAPIFFNFISSSVVLLMAACWLMLFHQRSRWTVAIEVALVGYAVIIFQARTIYLQLFALAAFFVWFRPRVFGRGVVGLVFIVFALLLLPLLGLEIEGRLGEKASLEFFVNHLLSIGGIEAAGVEGSAHGVSLRLGWWHDTLGRVFSGFGTAVTGLGFGMPLTDFITPERAIVREPHNSYISVLGRMGLTGAVAFVWMHAVLLRAWYRAYRTSTRLRWHEGQNRLLILMAFFVLIWVYAIGEDAFEKPFFAAPYYFFWGVALRMAWLLKRQAETIVPSARPVATLARPPTPVMPGAARRGVRPLWR